MFLFISYLREDSQFVLMLKDAFVSSGIECFIDTENIDPGEEWETRIRREIDSCDCFLACFSEHYSTKRSTYINREIEIALEGQRRIFPVWLSGGMPELPEAVRPALQRLNWTSLARDTWLFNVGRLLSAMLAGRTVRGAGLNQLTQSFSTAGKNEKVVILQNLKYMLDLPEAMELLERGLLDPEESVRFQALSTVPYGDETGATLARGVLLNSSADATLQISLIYSFLASGKGPSLAPAILQLINARLSRNPDAEEWNRELNDVGFANLDTSRRRAYNHQLNVSKTALLIRELANIGEPAQVIRDGLLGVQSDDPLIKDAVRDALAKLPAA